MAINKKKEGTAKLSTEVAKQFTTDLKGWSEQNFFCPFTDTKFKLEELTVDQVERMIRRGSKSFVKVEAKAAAVEPAKGK
jgi:uncharacterized protein (DUF2225 family)